MAGQHERRGKSKGNVLNMLSGGSIMSYQSMSEYSDWIGQFLLCNKIFSDLRLQIVLL